MWATDMPFYSIRQSKMRTVDPQTPAHDQAPHLHGGIDVGAVVHEALDDLESRVAGRVMQRREATLHE
jgi:hypothetical protein